MKKKNNLLARAAMTLLLAVLSSVGVWAADVVTVGSGSTASSDLPSNQNSKYCISQQIYTSSEIGRGGMFTSIAFYNYDTGRPRMFDIYLTHIAKTSFDNNSDWITVSATDLVFSGTVELIDWTAIDLDKPFVYNGTQSLLLTIVDKTGNSVSNDNLCSAFDGYHQALYYKSSTDLDPTQPIGETGTFNSRKNIIKLCFETYPKPNKLVALDIADVSALIQCNLRGDATAWNLQYRKAGTEAWTTLSNLTERSKTIEGLTPNTQYEVQVQAIFAGNNLSSWTDVMTFTTNCCPLDEQKDVAYKLRSTNGWYNAAVQIVDVTDAEKPIEVALLRSPSSGLIDGVITLCCGHEYKVNWIYDAANAWNNGKLGFELYFEPGDLFYSMAYGEAPVKDEELTEFIMDCTPYCAPMPKNISIDDIFHDGALLSFTSATPTGKIAYSTEADFNPATATNTMSVTFDASGHGFADGSADGREVSYRLNGLDPLTDYYVAIQSVCTAQPYDDGGHSRWTKPKKITTGPEEAPVEDVTVVNDGPAKTQVGWTPKGQETKHNVYIRQQTSAGTPVNSSQIQVFDLDKDGYTFTQTGEDSWGSFIYDSTPNDALAEVSNFIVITDVPGDAVVKSNAEEGKTSEPGVDEKAKVTEVFSAGAEKQENNGSDAEALQVEIQSKITNLKKVRDNGKKLTKTQWRTKYAQYKKALSDWYNAEEGSAEEKTLDEQVKSLKRELGLDKKKVKKALKHSINSGYKAYKKARKSKKNRAGNLEKYFVWIDHEEGNGFLDISGLEIVTEENWGEWTSFQDVTNNSYTFDHLIPGTTYEVMIEPVYDDGTTGTETTFMFTTLGEETDPTPADMAFSVSEGKKVRFAKGNLQYQGDRWGEEGEWSLAKHQYEMLGESNVKPSGSDSYPAEYRDVFCWSTTSTRYGIYSYYSDEDNSDTWAYFHDDLMDWGTKSAVIEAIGAGWSTLKKDEWNYLLNERPNAATRKAFATLAGVKGLIILPDVWTLAAPASTYTAEQWTTLEEAGAIFLPAAGKLSTVYNPDTWETTTTYSPGGFYWTSSPADASIANAMNFAGGVTFDDTQVAIGNLSRRTYNAVRLAKTIEMPVTTSASGFTTLVSTETLDFSNVEGLTAYIATNVDNGSDKVTLKSIGVVPANTPIVLKGAPNTKYRVSTTVTTANPPAGNLLRGSATKSVELTEGAAYILSGGKFCKNAAGTMPAGKAYLPAAVTTSNARALVLFFDDDATAIQTLEVEEEPIRTGIYNLQGQRVKTPGKGLYIIDGKKVIIK